MPSYVVNGANLVGGSTTPTIATQPIRSFSTAIDFDPVDYRFLNTVSTGFKVEVRTNNVPSVCTGQCGYTFNPYT